ncbi:hypothetical protein GP486_005213 [Trichoglossum hirsutum]|uniref:Uncharacterized protein n=1 Tax=Trichoglossum hirsutum TaxID=265104 RepID=A0A9P8L9P1_9PEZI|nr:hypothetical protein GP486_005213 [Trichoglossum hirsutum]
MGSGSAARLLLRPVWGVTNMTHGSLLSTSSVLAQSIPPVLEPMGAPPASVIFASRYTDDCPISVPRPCQTWILQRPVAYGGGGGVGVGLVVVVLGGGGDVVVDECDDELVDDDDVLVEDDDLLVEDDDVLVKDDDLLVKDDDVLVEDDDLLVKDDDVLVEDDDLLVEDVVEFGAILDEVVDVVLERLVVVFPGILEPIIEPSGGGPVCNEQAESDEELEVEL